MAVLMNNKALKKQIFKGDGKDRIAQAVDTDLFSAFTTNKNEAREIVKMIDEALGKGAEVKDIVNTLTSMYKMRGGEGVMHFEREMNCLVNGIKDFGLDTGENAKIALKENKYLISASDMLTGMRGQANGDPAVFGWLTALNNMTMLSMATIASLSDVALIGARAGAVMPYLKGLHNTIRQMANADPATRDAIRAIGVHLDGDRCQNFLNNNTGRIQGLNNAFFKATGLTQWTAFSRQMAANVGFEAIKCWQRQAREAIANGTQDSRQYKQAIFWLRKVGLNDPEFINGKALSTYGDLMSAAKANPSLSSIYDRVNRGVVKFVNESAFAPNRGDIPAWAQTGFGRLAFQFKSYPTMLGRLTRWTFDSLKKENGRNATPLVMLATLGVGMGAGGQALRDVIAGRNLDYEDDSQSFSDMHSVNYRKRLASEICNQMGWSDLANSLESSDLDSLIGWYASGLMGLGALGVVGDFIFGLTEETNNGAFGDMNVAKQFFGPSFGDVMDAWNVGKTGFNMTMEGLGIKDERPSNRDERRAFGAIVSRVPLVGGLRSVNKTLKDYLVPLEES